jgi:hypothetical protein
MVVISGTGWRAETATSLPGASTTSRIRPEPDTPDDAPNLRRADPGDGESGPVSETPSEQPVLGRAAG